MLFTLLTFSFIYPAHGTKLDITTLMPIPSLTDFDRFLIFAAIFSGSTSFLVSLLPQLIRIFSGMFSMIGLTCQCM